MPVVGFRAGISGFGGSGWQPCGQAPTYYPVYFRHAYQDDAGRYDEAGAVWRPVAAGEVPRRVTMGAQVTILAGAKAVGNPIFSLKIQRNALYDVAAGQAGMDAGKPGFAEMQVTTTAMASAGDFFNVIVLASAWSAGDPAIPFPSPWTPGSQPTFGPSNYSALDNNQFHTYFWGTDYRPDPPAIYDDSALKASIASLQTGVANLRSNVADLQRSLGNLQSEVRELEEPFTGAAGAVWDVDQWNVGLWAHGQKTWPV